jgi:hypothetical protein
MFSQYWIGRQSLARFILAGICFWLEVVTPACWGIQLVYEPFHLGDGPGEYYVGPIHGQPVLPSEPLSEGEAFFDGPWVDSPGLSGQMIQASNLVPGTPAGSVIASGDGRAARYLATPWDHATEGTFYVGFLANFGALANPETDTMGYRSVEFWDANTNIPTNITPILSIGYSPFAGCPAQICVPEIDWHKRMQFRAGNTGALLTDYTFQEDGATHVIIIKFDLQSAPASDTLSVFLDPNLFSAMEPEIPTATATNLNFTLGAIGTISTFGASGILPVFDELLVTTTFADFFDITEPPMGPCLSDFGYACYLEIVSHLGLSSPEVGYADIDGDGIVTIADYRIWKDNRSDLTVGAGSSAAVGVPEPGSWQSLILAMAALAATVRRARILCIQ